MLSLKVENSLKLRTCKNSMKDTLQQTYSLRVNILPRKIGPLKKSGVITGNFTLLCDVAPFSE
jgi:hypothetical protein